MSYPESNNFFEFGPLVSGQPSPELILGRDGYLSFEIAPTGGNVTGLKLQTILNQGGAYEDDLVDGDFSSSTILELIRVSGSPPQSTPDGSRGWARLHIGLVQRVRFVPTLSGGTVMIRGVK